MSAESQLDQFEELRERNPDALLADGFEGAYLGYVTILGSGAIAVYSRQRCLAILWERDGMSYEEAEEFFNFNVEGAYVGPYTPLFLEEAK